MGEGYGIIYRDVMRKANIPPQSKAIYAYLCSFADKDRKCYPGVDLMYTELGMSKTTFYKYMKILIQSGIIKVVQMRKGNRMGSNVYILNDCQHPKV